MILPNEDVLDNELYAENEQGYGSHRLYDVSYYDLTLRWNEGGGVSFGRCGAGRLNTLTGYTIKEGDAYLLYEVEVR